MDYNWNSQLLSTEGVWITIGTASCYLQRVYGLQLEQPAVIYRGCMDDNWNSQHLTYFCWVFANKVFQFCHDKFAQRTLLRVGFHGSVCWVSSKHFSIWAKGIMNKLIKTIIYFCTHWVCSNGPSLCSVNFQWRKVVSAAVLTEI